MNIIEIIESVEEKELKNVQETILQSFESANPTAQMIMIAFD